MCLRMASSKLAFFALCLLQSSHKKYNVKIKGGGKNPSQSPFCF